MRHPSLSQGQHQRAWHRAWLRRNLPLLAFSLLVCCLSLTSSACSSQTDGGPSQPHALAVSVDAPGSDAASSRLALRDDPKSRCMPLPATRKMLTPAEIAHPRQPGRTISDNGYVARCVWHGLVVPTPASGVPHVAGQVILVSEAQQWLWAYENGRLVFATPITSGRPYLQTPRGTYQILSKRANTTFYSPWPYGSPYYYAPEHINYALYFRAGGYYIHDAAWRENFGPGSNLPHTTPSGARETGSHGCVNVTPSASKWLYSWAKIGATVVITV
ncbi:MAG: hypothetical protein OJF49_001657 [Ktedonobacterales bacterium]|nr:MAG: hypothetical protein OJF49_001657 [Ktedonobacterales bacterium]